MLCKICKKNNATLKHHYCYQHNKIINICNSCHLKIHRSNELKYTKFLSNNNPNDFDEWEEIESLGNMCYKYKINPKNWEDLDSCSCKNKVIE